jgi:type VI secretion system Hcp family effector
MKAKRKTMVRAGLFALAALLLFALIIGAGGIPPESIAAAEGRGFAVMQITGPTIQGPYTYPGPGVPPNGIKVIDIDFDVTAGVNSDDPNDPWAIKPQFSEFTITKEFDRTSPDLDYYCALGQHFTAVTLYMIPAEPPTTPPPYYLIMLEDAVITQVKSRMVYRSTDQKYAHLETVSLKCGTITWENVSPPNSRSWDLVHNEAP